MNFSGEFCVPEIRKLRTFYWSGRYGISTFWCHFRFVLRSTLSRHTFQLQWTRDPTLWNRAAGRNHGRCDELSSIPHWLQHLSQIKVADRRGRARTGRSAHQEKLSLEMLEIFGTRRGEKTRVEWWQYSHHCSITQLFNFPLRPTFARQLDASQF